MQTIGDIRNWYRLEPGVEYEFHQRARPLTLELNSSAEVAVLIHFEDEEEPRLLATVKGRDTVKYVVPDVKFAIMHVDPEVMLYMLTGDGTFQHRSDMGAEKFTKIHEGRRLSPELQEMYDKMNRNAMRNQERLLREVELLREERYRASSAAITSAPAQEPVPVRDAPIEPPSGDGPDSSTNE